LGKITYGRENRAGRQIGLKGNKRPEPAGKIHMLEVVLRGKMKKKKSRMAKKKKKVEKSVGDPESARKRGSRERYI